MNTELKNRFLLLSNYNTEKTLSENLGSINVNLIIEGPAQTSVESLLGVLGLAANDGQKLFDKIRAGSGGLSKYKSLDEFKTALKNVKSEKEYAKILTDITTGLKGSARASFKEAIMATKFGENMKSAINVVDNNPEVLKSMFKYYETLGLTPIEIAEMTAKATGREVKEINSLINKSIVNVGKTANNLKDLKGTSNEVKKYLKDVKTPTEAVNNIGSNLKTAADAGVDVSKFQKIGKKIGKYVPESFNKIKSLAPKMNLKNLLIFGLAGGVSAIIMKQLFGDDPNPDVLDPCVVNSNQIQLGTTSTGDIMGFIKSTGNKEYDNKGGLKFYSNGRVFLGDNSKKGRYSCSTGGQLTIGESTKKKKLNEETVLGNIEINWDESPASTKPTAVSIPNELDGNSDGKGDTEGVKYFQDWLDSNYAGWAQGYPDGKVSKGKGYGKFGTRTQNAWKKHGQSFITFIGTRTQTKPADELESQTKLTNPMNQNKGFSNYRLTNTSQPTTQPTPTNTTTVDDGTTLPPGAEGPLNDPNYQPNTQSGAQQTQTGTQQISSGGKRRRSGLRNLLRRNN